MTRKWLFELILSLGLVLFLLVVSKVDVLADCITDIIHPTGCTKML